MCQQENIPVWGISPAFLVRGGVSPSTAEVKPPWMQTPPRETKPPGGRPHPLEAEPLDAGHVTCEACWEANPAPCEQNDTQMQKHYLAQTSFASGKRKASQSMGCGC